MIDTAVLISAGAQLYFLIDPPDTHGTPSAIEIAARAIRFATALVLIGRCLGWW